MKKLNTTLGAFLLGVLTLTSQAEDAAAEAVQIDGAKVGQWTMDFDAAKELASEKKLPLLLNFTGSDWCGWCKLMDKNVFAQKPWQEFASSNVLLVTLDFPKDKSIVPEKYVKRNEELKNQFSVRGFPTYVILDTDGETKIGQLGAGREKTPDSFITEFKNVVRMSESSIEAYLKANPDKADEYKAAIQGVKDAKKALTDWIATGPQRNEENNKKYADFMQAIKDAEDKLSKF